MFPTLTSFEKDLNNPYMNRTISNGSGIGSSLSLQSSQSVSTCSKLLVSNLPMNYDHATVHKFLKNFGKIKTLELIKDPMTAQYSVKY
jgi:RNA recognition motif. (a.k.a. RRM, RBD, or RNP domain)